MEETENVKRKNIWAFLFADIFGFIIFIYSLLKIPIDYTIPIYYNVDEVIVGLAIIMYPIFSVFVFLYINK